MASLEIILAIAAGAGFAAAGALGGFGVHVGDAVRTGAASVAAGILLPLAVIGLFTEATHHATMQPVAVAFAAGFALLFLAEATSKAHTHHDDGHAEQLAQHHRLRPFLLGLGLHNVADGAVLATAAELSADAMGAAVAGILVHQLPVGVSFAAVAIALGLDRRRLIVWACLLGAVIPLVAAVVSITGGWSDAWLGVMLAGSAGALVYVAAGHLLPAAQAEDRRLAAVLVFPVALLLTATFLGAVAHPHL